jgi:amidohydrolase
MAAPDTSSKTAAEWKAIICTHIDALADELIGLSHDIHAHPELAFEEHHASAVLTASLAAHGLSPQHPAFGLATSFVARAGDIGPNVVICCEYDALPGIGHGCGHNIIGTAGLGAGLALASVAQAIGGRVTILGTPAEEGGLGKVRLLEAGAFADADVAMMVHPEPANVEIAPYLANDQVTVTMSGKAAHASSSPWAGVNALDALVLGYTGMLALKATLRSDERLHGIITNGGDVDNVIPAVATGVFRVRAKNARRLSGLKDRLTACFEGAAAQIGARCELSWRGPMQDVRANTVLAAAFRRNGESLDRVFLDPKSIPYDVAGSTDMGNVSYAVPSIHPVIDVGALVGGHTVEMTAASIARGGDAAVIDGAKMLAMTAIDVWLDSGLLEAARAEFARLSL